MYSSAEFTPFDSDAPPPRTESTPLLQSGASTRGKRKRSVTISCEVQQEIVDYNPDDIKLRKHITLPVTVGIIIGNVIGSGIFISPVNVVGSVGSVGGALLIWLTVGLYCLMQALCYAELGTVIPKAGGDYAYIYYILGPLPAFMCVWMHVAMICTSTDAAIARTAAVYLLQPFQAHCHPAHLTLLAVLIIVSFAIVNMLSTRIGAFVQNAFCVAKVLALLLIIITGIVHLAQGNTGNFEHAFQGTTTQPGLLALAVMNGYFAFKGWELVCTLPEEMVDPRRDLPRGIVIAMLSITSIYVLTNVAFFAVLSLDELFASDAVALTYAGRLMPRFGPWFISVSVAMSCIGAINGSFLGDTRYLFAAGRFEQVPRVFSMLNFNFYTPVMSIGVVCVLTCLYTLIPTVSELTEYASLGVQLKIMLSLVALLHLRRTRPDLPRGKLPTAVVVGTLVLLLGLVGFSFFQSPRVTGIGIGIFLAGVPLYALGNCLKRSGWACRVEGAMTTYLQLLLHIVPESSKSANHKDDTLLPRDKLRD